MIITISPLLWVAVIDKISFNASRGGVAAKRSFRFWVLISRATNLDRWFGFLASPLFISNHRVLITFQPFAWASFRVMIGHPNQMIELHHYITVEALHCKMPINKRNGLDLAYCDFLSSLSPPPPLILVKIWLR